MDPESAGPSQDQDNEPGASLRTTNLVPGLGQQTPLPPNCQTAKLPNRLSLLQNAEEIRMFVFLRRKCFDVRLIFEVVQRSVAIGQPGVQ